MTETCIILIDARLFIAAVIAWLIIDQIILFRHAMRHELWPGSEKGGLFYFLYWWLWRTWTRKRK